MKSRLILTILFVLCIGVAYSQDSTLARIQTIEDDIKSLKSFPKSHFMIRGFAQSGLAASKDNVSFNMTSFNPVLLWRQGDRFLFESELEMEYEGNRLNLNLGYANASYVFSKGLVIRAGKLLIPFGTFGEKLHPSWINKFSTIPLGMGHDGLNPNADLGVEVRGGLQIGKSKLSYSLYIVNGPVLKDGIEEPEEAGMLSFENATDNNKDKAIGSRIAILPLSNSSLEIGFSGYYAKPGAAHSPFEGDTLKQDLNYQNVTALLTAVDFSYVKLISPIKGIIDIKGQYNLSHVGDATYYNPEDTSRYAFTNNSSAYYAQIAYRPAMVDNSILKNLEVVGRYSVYNTPIGSLWENEETQIAIGLNYWLSWRTVIKVSYQSTSFGMVMAPNGSMGGHATTNGNMIVINFATGL